MKSAFVEATGQASSDTAGYLDFSKGEWRKSLGKELLEKVDLMTEDNASKLRTVFSKEWQDANDKWNAMWGGVKNRADQDAA